MKYVGDLKQIKSIFKWSAIGFLIVLAIVGAGFGLLQTEAGKQRLAQWVADAISRELNGQVKIDRFEGLIPFDVQTARVVVEDRRGTWLTIENVHLTWALRPLTKGRLRVRSLTAAGVVVHRKPAADPETRRKIEPSFELPRLPPIKMDRLAIRQIVLAKGVLGERQIFTLNGSVANSKKAMDITGRLQFESIAGPKVQVRLFGRLQGESPVLTLNGRLEEAEGGVVSKLMRLRKTGSLSMTLQGKGPLQHWAGKLRASAAEIGRIESDIRLNLGQAERRISGDGFVSVVQWRLPPTAHRLLGQQPSRFQFDLGYDDRSMLTIHGAQLKTSQLDLKLSGRIDLKKRLLTTSFSTAIQNLAILAPIAGKPVTGALKLEGTLEGDFLRPRLQANLQLEKLHWDTLQAAHWTSKLHVKAAGPSVFDPSGVQITGEGTVTDLKYAGMDDLLPKSLLQYRFETTVPRQGPVVIRQLMLSGDGMTLQANGRVDRRDPVFEGNLSVDLPDLKRFGRFLPYPFEGQARLDAQVRASGSERRVAAQVSGTLSRLAVAAPFIRALTGSQLTYKGDIQLVGKEQVVVSDAQIEAAAGRLRGEGTFDLTRRTLSIGARLQGLRLAEVSAPYGLALDGAMDVKVAVDGDFASPRLRGDITGHRLSFGGRKVDRAEVKLQAVNLFTNPSGDVQLAIQPRGIPLQARSSFSYTAGNLTLPDLKINAPQTEIGGNVQVRPAGGAFEATLAGHCDDLFGLERFWGEPIQGRGRFQTRISGDRRDQRLAAEIIGVSLKSRFGTAKGARLKINLNDFMQNWHGDAALTLEDYHRGDLTLETAVAQIEGNRMRMDIESRIRGHWREAFDVTAGASLVATAEHPYLEINRMQGRLGRTPVDLLTPVKILKTNDRYILEEMHLRWSRGRIKAAGRLDSMAIDLDMQVDDLPLATWRALEGKILSGSVSGKAHVRGALAHPEVKANLKATGIRVPQGAYPKLPPASLTVDLHLQNEWLQIEMALKGLTEEALTAGLKIPARLSLSPFAFALDENRPLEGKLSGAFNLSELPLADYFEDQKLIGLLQVEVSLSNSIRSPDVRGRLTFSKGSYEYVRHGLVLKDINLQAGFSDKRLSVETMTVSDGEQGRINVRGAVSWERLQNPSFEFVIEIENSTLIRRDDLTLKAGGTLNFTGTLAKAMLAGQIRIEKAEFQIPDQLAEEIVALEVQEINSSAQKPAATPDIKKKRGSFLKLDLLVESPGQIFIRGRGLDSEWKGRLNIGGHARQPRLEGDFTVVRGRYRFAGRPLTLKKGRLTFSGNLPPDPQMEVLAESRRRQVNARILILGSPSAPSIRLESDPPLPSDEILAYLLFGKQVSSITPYQALMLAQAVNVLSGKKSLFDFMDRSRKILAVDRLDVNAADEGKPTVNIGKYLRDDVYMEMEQGMGTDSGKVTIEMEIAPNVTVQSEVGMDANTGIGINWKWDY